MVLFILSVALRMRKQLLFVFFELCIDCAAVLSLQSYAYIEHTFLLSCAQSLVDRLEGSSEDAKKVHRRNLKKLQSTCRTEAKHAWSQ